MTRRPNSRRKSYKNVGGMLPGAVCVQYVTGRDGVKRGPYYVRFWYEHGRRYRAYVRKRDLKRVRSACEVWRYDERQRQRLAVRYSRMTAEQLIAELRKVEQWLKQHS